MRFVAALVLSIFVFQCSAQKKIAIISGQVIDDNENFMPGVSVVVLGKNTGISTDDSGRFRIKVPAERTLALVFSHSGFNEQVKSFFLSNNEEEKIIVQMEKGGKTLENVI